MVSSRMRWPESGRADTRAGARGGARRRDGIALSFIRTVTVGPGIAPDLLTPRPRADAGARGLLRSRADTAGGEFRPALRTLPACRTGSKILGGGAGARCHARYTSAGDKSQREAAASRHRRADRLAHRDAGRIEVVQARDVDAVVVRRRALAVERIDAAGLQKKWRAVRVWNWYSVNASAPASSRSLLSCTLTISALRRRHIEQSHIVSSGKSLSISKRTAPQWQLPW